MSAVGREGTILSEEGVWTTSGRSTRSLTTSTLSMPHGSKGVCACELSDQMLEKLSPIGLATELSSARGLQTAGLGVVGWAVLDKVHQLDAFVDISA